MAKPRVFVSSTFYDLRQVREDLERFISGLGYEAVLYEAGDIAYGKDSPPEGYVHREIEMCDILVCVIGGRYGTESKERPGVSITQQELRAAIESQVQVFIFIEQGVYSEYSTYLVNKGTENIKYHFVDDIRIYEFIESVYNLPSNNPIAPFQTAFDIVEFLKNQWAGIFQRFLQYQKRLQEIRALEKMNIIAGTLQQLVTFLTEERKGSSGAIQQILLADHSVFHRLRQLTKTSYRVFFTDEEELDNWLLARGWSRVRVEAYDEGSYREWLKSEAGEYLRLTEGIFDGDGNLKMYSRDRWQDEWLDLRELPHGSDPPPDQITADDLPF